MRIKKWATISRDNLPKDVPPWIDEILQPINKAMRELVDLTLNKILLSDNLDCEIKEIEAADSTTYSLKLIKVKNPKLVLMGLSTYFDYCSLKWRRVEADRIEVALSWTTPPTAAQKVTLFIIGG